MKENKVQKRVNDLLRLAEDQADKPEGKLAGEFAAKLIEKYGLSKKESDRLENEVVPDKIVCVSVETGRYNWSRYLFLAIAESWCCRLDYASNSSTSEIYGFSFDVERAIELFNFFYRSFNEQSLAWKREGNHSRKAMNAFRLSLVCGLASKLKARFEPHRSQLAILAVEQFYERKGERERARNVEFELNEEAFKSGKRTEPTNAMIRSRK